MKQGWEIKRLGEVAIFVNGDRGKNYPSQHDFVDDGVPFINAGHLVGGSIDFASMNYISEEKYNQLGAGKIVNGDILFCLRGSLGKRAIVKDVNYGAIASSLVIIRSKNVLLNRYLFHYLGSQTVQNLITKNDNGSSQPNLSAKSVSDFSIPIPPREEQERVVAELDCLSGVIERKREQLRELDALAQSIFYQMFGDPIINEKGWEIKKWKEVFDTRTGKLNANVMNENGKYPFFTCSKDIYYIDTYAFDCEALLLAGNNATANYDVKYYKGKFNAYQRTYVLTLKDNSLYKFFKFALENKLSLLQEQSIGGMTKYLTLGILHKIEFIVPPLTLQQEFADKIEAIEKQRELIKQSITQTEELFNSRMDYYFN